MRLFVALGLLLPSCCGDDDGDEAAQACRDTADAVADAADRCGLDYRDYYDDFLQSSANGDCDNVFDLRDSDELYERCIPSIAEMSCDLLVSGEIDSSCDGQLVRVEH